MRLRGKAEDLDKISSTNLSAVADLTDTTATGTMDTSHVEIRVDGALNVGAVGHYRLTFDISR